jgi:hypothetical protein
VEKGGEKMGGGRTSLEWKWWRGGFWIGFKILLSGGKMRDVVDFE